VVGVLGSGAAHVFLISAALRKRCSFELYESLEPQVE